MLSMLANEGKVDLAKPVSTYVPALKGSAWDNITVKNTMNMAVAVDNEETFESLMNPQSWISSFFTSVFGVGGGDPSQWRTLLKNVEPLPNEKPGDRFRYSTSNTQVLVFINEHVTQMPWQAFWNERVWSKFGASSLFIIGLTPDGTPVAGGLNNTTPEDMLRYALLYTPSWHVVSDEQVISDAVCISVWRPTMNRWRASTIRRDTCGQQLKPWPVSKHSSSSKGDDRSLPIYDLENSLTMSTELELATRQDIRQAAGWGIAVGVLLIILGIVAIALPFATVIALSLLFGWLFMLGGIAQLVYAFVTRQAGSFIWKLLLGLFYLLGGILVLLSPGITALTLSLILAISILVQSVIQVIDAFQIKPAQGWGWTLFSGITGIILGILIFSQGPASAVWLLGLWFGLNLLFDGIGVLMLSSAVRSAAKG